MPTACFSLSQQHVVQLGSELSSHAIPGPSSSHSILEQSPELVFGLQPLQQAMNKPNDDTIWLPDAVSTLSNARPTLPSLSQMLSGQHIDVPPSQSQPSVHAAYPTPSTGRGDKGKQRALNF